MSKRGKDTGWITLAWLLNIAGLGAIALILTAYLALKPVSDMPPAQPPPAVTDFPAFTPFPGMIDLPTVTRNPRSTEIVVETPTRFILPNGQRAVVIGYSVSGRP